MEEAETVVVCDWWSFMGLEEERVTVPYDVIRGF